MSEPEIFTERTPRIVAAAKLHRAAARRKAGRFLAEGENAVTSALNHGSVIEIFVTESAAQRFSFLLDATTSAPINLISDRAADHLSETVTSTGLFALCHSQLSDLATVVDSAKKNLPLISVPVETGEPGNAGTLVRVSDALGAAGVVFAGQSVDPQGGKAVRASAGSIFHLPVAREAGVAEVIDRLHEEGFTVMATAMDGDVSLEQAAVAEPGEQPILAQPTAWLFGNEAHGLGRWQDLADLRVSIPMRGRAESMNLATAASICLYESAKALAKSVDC
ncbi:RNA methyltransferase [uncultured Corynebacterium sp.]|uniref:TrmH family RNA methyltransferase n=1 Tax=uncultured Corynebacterium sp. TaxID=159447 RepID=UPI0025FB6A8C|nr:RNA methyltransferase [uncultured Corynebacterium sp.]